MGSTGEIHAKLSHGLNIMLMYIMLKNIMLLLSRRAELARLVRLETTGGLAVVYGRRRMGKTRLLLEWTQRRNGIYFVADQSTADLQRHYFAEAVAERLPGFADVQYRDWRALFARLVADAKAARFRGPLVLDELPYLVQAAPELPSVLQHFCDRAREARLSIGLAGSSRRSMQALALDPEAPLAGRVQVHLELGPLGPEYLSQAFARPAPGRMLDLFAAWGGVPRYWELAARSAGTIADSIDALVLDPGAILHEEPLRLLQDELPSAIELRPLLDAIGTGAHRVSEIAARIGRPATSLSRALDRLRELGLIEREIPFGQTEHETKRTQYRIVDPFLRLWFRVVAPHRTRLACGSKKERLELLRAHWPTLRAEAWQQLCRDQLGVPHKRPKAFGAWGPARPFWQGSSAEWDLVSRSLDGKQLLLGATRVHDEPLTLGELAAEAQGVAIKNAPSLGRGYDDCLHVRALFLPRVSARTPKSLHGVRIVTYADLIPSAPKKR